MNDKVKPAGPYLGLNTESIPPKIHRPLERGVVQINVDLIQNEDDEDFTIASSLKITNPYFRCTTDIPVNEECVVSIEYKIGNPNAAKELPDYNPDDYILKWEGTMSQLISKLTS